MTLRATAEISAPEFDLARTLHSGQIFHAMPSGTGWQVLVDGISLEVEQSGETLRVPARHEELARRYFALDHPLEAIYASFPTDPFSRAALASCRGLRILRQPLWECLGTFITSPMKQVAHIRQMSLHLRERFGKEVPGSPINSYPAPEILAEVSEDDLRACGLGFRAKNLRLAATEVAEGRIDLAALRDHSTTDVREALCTLPGVGRKVANCVILFAYERLESVPVDVWIARILQAMRRRKGTLEELERFSARRFGHYAGYVQQYLFHHARMTRSLPT
jgi:N-glycosylase/DNA lyase